MLQLEVSPRGCQAPGARSWAPSSNNLAGVGSSGQLALHHGTALLTNPVPKDGPVCPQLFTPMSSLVQPLTMASQGPRESKTHRCGLPGPPLLPSPQETPGPCVPTSEGLELALHGLLLMPVLTHGLRGHFHNGPSCFRIIFLLVFLAVVAV